MCQFCSRGSQAGWQMARVQAPACPVARPRPPWVCSSVSLIPADTRPLSPQVYHHLPPRTQGEVPMGAPRQSIFASTLQGPLPTLTPQDARHGAKLSSLSLVLWLCWGRTPEDRGGLGCALPFLPPLRPSGLETCVLKWPFVHCPCRTGSLEGGAGTAGAAWGGWG